MTPTRSPAKRKPGASESGSTSVQPSGVFSRQFKQTESNRESTELLVLIFEQSFPGIADISELSKGDRAGWIRFREGVLQGQGSVTELAKALGDAIGRRVDAEIGDIQARRQADNEDKKERRKDKRWLQRERQKASARQLEANLEDQTQRRGERRARLKQEVRERETRRINQSRKDNLLMAMTGVSFLFAIVLLIVAVASRQPIAYSGSGFFAAVSLAGIARLFLVGQSRIDAPPLILGGGKGHSIDR